MSENDDTWSTVVNKKNLSKKSTKIVASYESQEKLASTSTSTTTTPSNQISQSNGGKRFVQNKSGINLKKLEEGTIRPAKVDRTLATKIRDARLAKGLTQDALNGQCGLKPHTIKNYENMTAIADQSEIDKIKKVLGVNDLKKPKAIVIKPEN